MGEWEEERYSSLKVRAGWKRGKVLSIYFKNLCFAYFGLRDTCKACLAIQASGEIYWNTIFRENSFAILRFAYFSFFLHIYNTFISEHPYIFRNTISEAYNE